MPETLAMPPTVAHSDRARSRSARGAHLSLDRVSKRYAEFEALRPINLEIEPGEFFSLIGPSGSGKTTLLGAVAGFVPPSDGRILVDGRDIVAVAPYRRNIGMVFQNYSLFPHMSVFDNIAFPLRMRKVPEEEVEARVRRMLGMIRLDGMERRMPHQLSGGQQQRVALARAAVYDPPLLLMDEPLGALDKNLREEMQFEIKRFHEEVGATVLYVTHDQDEAATMSDRLAILNHGRLEQVGEPRALYESPRNEFVASFLGQANLFDVVALERDGLSLRCRTAAGQAFEVPHLPDGEGPFVACIRPESIAIGMVSGGARNTIAGQIVDVVFSAGTIRYRVRVDGGHVVTVRSNSSRQANQARLGDSVQLSWDVSDTLIIPKH